MIDHNLYVDQLGAILKNLRGRYLPPLPYYLAAPFVGVSGTGSLWPRIPFAICGLLSVALLLYWMYRSRLSAVTWVVLSIGLVCNISFFLYCRQCRYYSLALLFSLVIAYLYLNWKGKRWQLAGIVLASILLLGANYLSYAALYTILACDYLIFGRRERRLTLRQWIMLLTPQILVGAVIIWIYNPLGIKIVGDVSEQNFFIEKITVLWRNFRDLNNCEFCVGIIMLAGLPVYYFTRNVLLLRGLIAVVCYCIIVAIISPQPTALSQVADVRYLAPLLPLLIGISTLVIVSVTRWRWYFAIPLSIAVFGFNVLNYPFTPSYWCSRPAEFMGELCSPRDTSISLAAKWIDDHVHEGESIVVYPHIFEPPLQYHAPKPIYAWHLLDPPKEQFASLPRIHFFLSLPPPDYFIVFGVKKKPLDTMLEQIKDQGVDYRVVEVLDIYWDDMTRPEILLRSFRPIKVFDLQTEAVYVYQRVTPR